MNLPEFYFNPKAVQQQLHPHRIYFDPDWRFGTDPQMHSVAKIMEDGGVAFCGIWRNSDDRYDLYLYANNLIICDFETFGQAEWTAREYWFAHPNSWVDPLEEAIEIDLLDLPDDELLALLDDDPDEPFSLAPWVKTMLEDCDEE